MSFRQLDAKGNITVPKIPKKEKPTKAQLLERKKRELAELKAKEEAGRETQKQIAKFIGETQKPKSRGLAAQRLIQQYQDDKIKFDEFADRILREAGKKLSPEEAAQIIEEKKVIEEEKKPKAAPAAVAPAEPEDVEKTAEDKTKAEEKFEENYEKFTEVVKDVTSKISPQVQSTLANLGTAIENLIKAKASENQIIDEFDNFELNLQKERAKKPITQTKEKQLNDLETYLNLMRVYTLPRVADVEDISELRKQISGFKSTYNKIQREKGNKEIRQALREALASGTNVPKTELDIVQKIADIDREIYAIVKKKVKKSLGKAEADRQRRKKIDEKLPLEYALGILGAINSYARNSDVKQHIAYEKAVNEFFPEIYPKKQKGEGLGEFQNRLAQARENLRKAIEFERAEQKRAADISEAQKPKIQAVEARSIIDDYYKDKISLSDLEQKFKERLNRDLSASEKKNLIKTKKLIGEELKEEERKILETKVIEADKTITGKPLFKGKTNKLDEELKKITLFASTPKEKERLDAILENVPIESADGKIRVGKLEVNELLSSVRRFIRSDRNGTARELSVVEQEIVRSLKKAFKKKPALAKKFSPGISKAIMEFQSGKGFNQKGVERNKEIAKKRENTKMNRIIMTSAMNMADQFDRPEVGLGLLKGLKNADGKKVKQVEEYIRSFM